MSRSLIFDYFKPVVNAKTIDEVAKLSGLDFRVKKAQLFYEFEEKGIPQQWGVPRYMGHIRGDNGLFLGIGGTDYGIVQYIDALRFTEEMVGKGIAEYVSAGPTGNGEHAFVVMRTKDSFLLSNTDKIQCYFYLTSSHDSSLGLTVVPAPYVALSKTTISPPVNMTIKFKHTKHVMNHLHRAQKSFNKVHESWEKFQTSFEFFKSVKLNGNQAMQYFECVFPDSGENPKRAQNIRNDMESIRLTSPVCRLPACYGTLLGAYLAAVEFIDQHRPVRKPKHNSLATADLLSKLDISGSGARQKAQSYGAALTILEKYSGIKL